MKHVGLRGEKKDSAADGEGVVQDAHASPRRQETPPQGMRPGSFAEPAPHLERPHRAALLGGCSFSGHAGPGIESATLSFLVRLTLEKKEEEEAEKREEEARKKAAKAKRLQAAKEAAEYEKAMLVAPRQGLGWRDADRLRARGLVPLVRPAPCDLFVFLCQQKEEEEEDEAKDDDEYVHRGAHP